MTVESLLDYGFKEYPTNEHDKHDKNWQYCVRTPKGKKLFVQIKFWQFSRYSNGERGLVQDAFSADCQFDMRGSKTFNVDISVNDMTPKQVVEWFDDMFNKMNCTYYECYSDENYDDEGNQVAYNCEQCGKYLGRDSEKYCPECKYELDSGFRQYVPKRKRKIR